LAHLARFIFEILKQLDSNLWQPIVKIWWS